MGSGIRIRMGTMDIYNKVIKMLYPLSISLLISYLEFKSGYQNLKVLPKLTSPPSVSVSRFELPVRETARERDLEQSQASFPPSASGTLSKLSERETARERVIMPYQSIHQLLLFLLLDLSSLKEKQNEIEI